ncbi:MAG: hypothetical protein HOO67_04725 [Candidatus Peribacteraceae bacterium]|nr:hypothetical protein [Candidatus Peribacteraceae bacterium]
MHDDTLLATSADIHRLERSIQKLADVIQEEMRVGFRRLREADDQILDVLVSVDKRLTGGVKDHEKRIRHLEKVVLV